MDSGKSFTEAVRALGGDLLVRPCMGKALPGLRGQPTRTCACNRKLRARFHYEGSNPKGPVYVCFVCDKAGNFPRVRKATT